MWLWLLWPYRTPREQVVEGVSAALEAFALVCAVGLVLEVAAASAKEALMYSAVGAAVIPLVKVYKPRYILPDALLIIDTHHLDSCHCVGLGLRFYGKLCTMGSYPRFRVVVNPSMRVSTLKRYAVCCLLRVLRGQKKMHVGALLMMAGVIHYNRRYSEC